MSEPIGTQALAHALAAYRRGYTPLPLQDRSKRPAVNWQTLTYQDEQAVRTAFEGHTGNLGVVLGQRSGNLVDVDIDWPRATLLAERFFLAGTTEVISGRVGSPASHWWYRCSDLGGGRFVWKHPDKNRFGKGKDVLIEIRSDGHQTAIPASIHPNGERYVWDGDEPWGGTGTEPGHIRGDHLRARCGLIALVSLLVIEWPGEGSRHDAHLALAGALLAEGYGDNRRVSPVWKPYMAAIIDAIRDLTHDREDRAAEVIESTIRKIQSGKPVQGWPTLAEMVGTTVADRAREFVKQIERDHGHERPASSPDGLDALLSGGDEPEDGTTPSAALESADGAPGTGSEHVIGEESDDAVFEAMVQREVLRMRVREEARERYRDGGSDQELQAVIDDDFEDFADALENAEAIDQRVEGLFTGGGVLLVAAQRKTGKTVFMLNLARSLITGAPLLGTQAVKPIAEDANVGFLNFEMEPKQIAEWFAGVADGDMEVMKRVKPFNLRGKRNLLGSRKGRAMLADAIRKRNCEVLLVDTFGAAFDGEDQNSAGETRRWLDELLRWAREDAGVKELVLTAHSGWSGNRARGSSALEDWPDDIIYLAADDADDPSSPRSIRARGRSANLEKHVVLFDEGTHILTLGDPVTTGTTGGAVQTGSDGSIVIDTGAEAAAEDAVREALTEASQPLRTNELVVAAMQSPTGRQAGVSRRKITNARDRMLSTGEVQDEVLKARGAPHVFSLNPDYTPPEPVPGADVLDSLFNRADPDDVPWRSAANSDD
jgi:hypothetical protein